MTEYTGAVQNLQMSQQTSKDGSKTYNLYAFNIEGVAKAFSKVYLKPGGPRLQNGMRITLFETAGKFGNDYTVTEAPNGNTGAAYGVSAAPANSWGKSAGDQSRISRQWAINAGIEVASKVDIPKAGKKGTADAALIAVIGHYASVFYAAAQSDEALAALSGYNGQINEVGDTDDTLPEDMRG